MNKSRKQIIFVHLLNDFSGSPLILSQVMNTADYRDFEKILFTSANGREGFLSGLPNVDTRYFWYRWAKNPWLRLISFSFSQALLFFQLLRYWRKDVTIYVNTLLPFGAGLAGLVMGKKVIYHVHETSMRPLLLKKFLRFICNQSADITIHVSNYLAEKERFAKPKNVMIYNSVSDDFFRKAADNWSVAPAGPVPFTVLMLCSLKKYKGVDQFVSLSRQLPSMHFELVLNASQQEVDFYFLRTLVPENLRIFAAQKNVHPFYARASLLVNLSLPDQWVETFGMTVLEAMCYAVPVIVPPVGGIAELVDDGMDGRYADSRDISNVLEQVRLISGDPVKYQHMREAALRKARFFSGHEFAKQFNEIFHQLLEREHESETGIQQHYKIQSS